MYANDISLASPFSRNEDLYITLSVRCHAGEYGLTLRERIKCGAPLSRFYFAIFFPTLDVTVGPDVGAALVSFAIRLVELLVILPVVELGRDRGELSMGGGGEPIRCSSDFLADNMSGLSLPIIDTSRKGVGLCGTSSPS